MSISCGNCDKLLGPSESLPGREAVLVTPIVPGHYWTIESDGSAGEAAGYAVGNAYIALCLECVQTKVPQDRQDALKIFYEMYYWERVLGRRKVSTGGFLPLKGMQIASLSHRDDCPDSVGAKNFLELHRRFKAGGHYDHCLLCGEAVGNTDKLATYFTATGIDRASCERVLSGLSFVPTNYSLSFMSKGMCDFKLCMGCVSSYGRLFNKLTWAMGNSKIEPETTKTEFVMTPEVAAKLMEGKSPQELKDLGQIIDKIAEDSDFRIDDQLER